MKRQFADPLRGLHYLIEEAKELSEEDPDFHFLLKDIHRDEESKSMAVDLVDTSDASKIAFKTACRLIFGMECVTPMEDTDNGALIPFRTIEKINDLYDQFVAIEDGIFSRIMITCHRRNPELAADMSLYLRSGKPIISILLDPKDDTKKEIKPMFLEAYPELAGCTREMRSAEIPEGSRQGLIITGNNIERFAKKLAIQTNRAKPLEFRR